MMTSIFNVYFFDFFTFYFKYKLFISRFSNFYFAELELDTDNIVEMDQQQTILKTTQNLDKIER